MKLPLMGRKSGPSRRTPGSHSDVMPDRSRRCGQPTNGNLMAELAKEIIPVNLEDEMRRSYLDYAMS
ncbi:MAG TPA: hypothetical protein VIT62_13345, partial [Lysobacter sp.]